MVRQLEVILQGTDHAHSLARDMLTPLIYDLEIAFVLDDSGSMNLDMPPGHKSEGFEGELEADQLGLFLKGVCFYGYPMSHGHVASCR